MTISTITQWSVVLGTSDVSLNSFDPDFFIFQKRVGQSSLVNYTIMANDQSRYEIGMGRITEGGVLTRTYILSSSSLGVLVDFKKTDCRVTVSCDSQKIYFDSGITRGGSGTATITEHEGTLQLGAGVTPGAWGNVPGIALLHGQDPWNLDFRCRIQSLSGGNSADVYIAAGIRETVSGASNAGIFINARGDGGSLTMYAETVPITGPIATTTTTRGDLAGGNFWMRVAISGSQVYGFYGIGAGGYQPTDWQMIGYYISANNHTTARLANCIMTLDAVGGGSPDDVTVIFDNPIISLK